MADMGRMQIKKQINSPSVDIWQILVLSDSGGQIHAYRI